MPADAAIFAGIAGRICLHNDLRLQNLVGFQTQCLVCRSCEPKQVDARCHADSGKGGRCEPTRYGGWTSCCVSSLAWKNPTQNRPVAVPLRSHFPTSLEEWFRRLRTYSSIRLTAWIGVIVVTLLALFFFEHIERCFTNAKPFHSAFQTVVKSGLAAAAAFDFCESNWIRTLSGPQ